MKHLKLFEERYKDLEQLIVDNITYNINDEVYCINDDDNYIGKDLKIGEKYKITRIYEVQRKYFFELNNIPYGYYPKRFTKDPNHPVLIQLTANKYNL